MSGEQQVADEERPAGSAVPRRGLLVTLGVVAGALVFYLGLDRKSVV